MSSQSIESVCLRALKRDSGLDTQIFKDELAKAPKLWHPGTHFRYYGFEKAFGSRVAMAACLGCNETHCIKWLQGKKFLGFDFCVKLDHYLGRPIDTTWRAQFEYQLLKLLEERGGK